MATTTEAQAPIETNEVMSTPAPETAPATETHSLDPQAQHDQLAELLANPEWTPEVTDTEGDVSDSAQSSVLSAQSEGADAAGGGEDKDNDEDEEAPAAEAGPESRDKGKRFRFSDPADRQFAVLRKEGVAPDEAARIAYGIGNAPAESPGAAHEAAPSDPLAAWRQELARVDGQLADAGANEGLITGDIVALIQRRTDLAAHIRAETQWREHDAREHQQAAQTAAKARSALQQESVLSAAERFPALAAPGSSLRAEADKLLQHHRGSAFLEEPNAPITLAEQAAVNVARAQAVRNGTTFEAEFRKLEATSPAEAARGPRNGAHGTYGTHRPKITPASGARSTLRPDQPASEEDRYREASATLDPRAQHDALDRLLYG